MMENEAKTQDPWSPKHVSCHPGMEGWEIVSIMPTSNLTKLFKGSYFLHQVSLLAA